MRAGESVTDFGCGTGRAARVFQRHGLRVLAVDHAANCLDKGIPVPLEIACLWDLPPHPVTDHGFCADVMEHVPPEHVEATLAGIARRVSRAAFFKISTVPDGCGKLIGETLHLTVRPAGWWLETVGRHFRVRAATPSPADIELVTVTPMDTST
jgi:2-polyprenyl-3-methyl-5-hydroxy-6-metoxy-1,4-benzoquinol methylase